MKKQKQDNQQNRKPCVNCGQLIQPLAHWSESYCYSYLQRRIARLEQELQQQHNKTVDLLTHIAHAQQSGARHNFSVMNFQFGKLDLAVKTGNIEQAVNAAKALTRAGITVLSYLGYWDVGATQEKLDKEVAGGLTKGG